MLTSAPMRRCSIRLAPLLALALSFASGGCRQATTRDGQDPSGTHKRDRGPELQLPDPLPLPSEPRAASWIAQPSAAVAMVAPYSPVPLDLRVAAEQALVGVTEPELARELAGAIDLSAPFANVVLDDGQEVIRLSLRADAQANVAARLAKLDEAGEFGAVTLPLRPSADGKPPRAGSRRWLAWIDEADGGALVLAHSLEGLVTGRTLAATYGEQPVFFTADPGQLAISGQLAIPVELPFSRVTGRGDLGQVTIEAQVLDGQDPFAEAPIAAGTLAGLLDSKHISAGASTRYADYQQVVREVIVEVNSAVSGLPFLVKGVAEGIAAKLNTALRTWDGRVLVALGPQNHVRLAYGASDVEKSRVAAIRLLQSVVDNVSLARNFSARIPKMTLRRKVAQADGVDIEQFTLYEAFSTAPELRPLVDKESRLHVAMAWSKRAGGGMIVVGPDAANELARWLDETSAADGAAVTEGQLLAASFAAEPQELQALLQAGNNADLAQLVGLAATGPRWGITVEPRGAGKYVIDLRAPGAAKPQRI
jgi:hypothetical protein